MRILQRIKCLFFYHDFRWVARLSESCAHIRCAECKREWGMNYDVQIILPWHTLAHFYRERGYDPHPISAPPSHSGVGINE